MFGTSDLNRAAGFRKRTGASLVYIPHPSQLLFHGFLCIRSTTKKGGFALDILSCITLLRTAAKVTISRAMALYFIKGEYKYSLVERFRGYISIYIQNVSLQPWNCVKRTVPI